MKFGGTSVGSPERIRALAERVRERLARRPVVVVSAFSKVTDLLVRGANLALARDSDYENVIFEILERHHGAINELVPRGPAQDRLLAHLDAIITELRALYTGVYHLAELTARTLDAISGVGERLSYEIVAAGLDDEGIAAQGVDARGVIITDDTFGRAAPLMEETRAAAARTIKPSWTTARSPSCPACIGGTQGRGHHARPRRRDWSAAVLGAALDAEEIQIWTDVDGMMTSIRLVPARVDPGVSFDGRPSSLIRRRCSPRDHQARSRARDPTSAS